MIRPAGSAGNLERAETSVRAFRAGQRVLSWDVLHPWQVILIARTGDECMIHAA